ncbi:hypothetical protein TWF694_002357 [Orbilia ellipsospora]|uniref:Probable acetate kinase n=1 Tax=Orbilia ellipsospora TaxID=2528407 RepID=A0AAV9X346_9PEZI
MSNKTPPTSVLSVNAGSSSLKLQIFVIPKNNDISKPKLLLKASISKLTSPPAEFTFKNTESDKYAIESQTLEKDINSVDDAFHLILEHLKKDESGFGAPKLDQITHVCHRVVHGGELGVQGPLVINHSVVKELEELTTLAPLHNGPAISVLKATSTSLKNATNIVFFDSSFHASLPDFIRTYPIDQKVAKERKLRKYGFHGLSYQWILKNTARFLGKDVKETSIIALHLGSGASMCAIKNGESYDTSMGLTPLEGLPGGSRSGTIDPSLIFHFTTHPSTTDQTPASIELSHAENILNSSSGFKSLTSTSDFSQILATNPPTQETTLTINIFLDRILNFFGAYWLKLNGGKGGVDAVVFSGGIGEGSPKFRKMIVDGFDGLNGGFDELVDGRNNNEDGEETVYSIGDGGGKVRLLVCKADEELQMVEECLADTKLW